MIFSARTIITDGTTTSVKRRFDPEGEGESENG